MDKQKIFQFIQIKVLSEICIGLLWSAFGRVPLGNHKVKIHLSSVGIT